MHMSDALITPIVGGAAWAASAGVISYSTKKLESEILDKRIAYMGVVGAFVFAAQMINFSIPGTGSSGHIGGGVLLAILLGPHAGFLAMATILLTQALFFADGGLLAYGCNVINLGLFTCYLAYPLIYKPLSRGSKKQLYFGTILATVIGLQLGAFSVVVETIISGRTELPFEEFLLFMQPIHLAIGLVEGLITATVVAFLYHHRDELIFDFFNDSLKKISNSRTRRRAVQVFLIVVVLVGGIFSQFASSDPDGLEWSIGNIVSEASIDHAVEEEPSEVQLSTAILPDYGFKNAKESDVVGTSVSGIVGSAIILLIIGIIGSFVRRFQTR